MQSQPVKSIFMFQSIACTLLLSIQYNFYWLSAFNVTIKTGNYGKILMQETTNGRLMCNSVTSG